MTFELARLAEYAAFLSLDQPFVTFSTGVARIKPGLRSLAMNLHRHDKRGRIHCFLWSDSRPHADLCERNTRCSRGPSFRSLYVCKS